MSTTPSQETVDQTKQQIRALIAEIAELSRSETTGEEFFPAVLKRIVDALAAVGGAIWLLDDEGALKLSYQINVNENLLEADGDDAGKHSKLLTRLFARGKSELVPANSMLGEDQKEGNPSQYLLVVSPLSGGRQPAGLIEIFQRPNSAPNIQRGYQRFLDQMAGLIGEWLKGHTLQKVSDRQLMWQQADHFARLVHDNLELRDTAFTIANEGRQLIGCDRVSVAMKKGRSCKVEAISGQDTIEKRSNIVTSLNALATRVVSTGEALWYDGAVKDLPPQLEEAIEDYVDLSHGRTIAILPIRRPEKVVEGDVQSKEMVQREDMSKREIIGALIVEQIESQVAPDMLRSRCDLVYEHAARALNNSMAHTDLFLMPLWRLIGRATWLFKGSAFPKTMAVLSAITIALLAMFLVQIDHDLEATGTLEPIVQRQVFTHIDGEVEEVMVRHGDKVVIGQPLVRLRNRELEFQMAEIEGQRQQTLQQINSFADLASNVKNDPIEFHRLGFQRRESEIRAASLNDQYALLLEKKKKLILHSPITGMVMTWDLRKNLLARPVVTGQLLVTVADPAGDFELELAMPEKSMWYLDKALAKNREEAEPGASPEPLDVDFILVTRPSENYTGKLTAEAIHERAELDSTNGAIVKLRVTPDSMEGISRRQGAEVTADITCGRGSAAFVWFHEVVEWVQANVLF